jgi:hypothetical protein
MRTVVRMLVVICVLLVNISLAFADIVHLKDGRTLEGEIISETKDTIRLKMALGEIELKREEIVSIEKKPFVPPEKIESQKIPAEKIESQETPEEKEKREEEKEQREIENLLEQGGIENLLKALHKKFYRKFALIDKVYIRLPDFDLRRESSGKKTREDWWKLARESQLILRDSNKTSSWVTKMPI